MKKPRKVSLVNRFDYPKNCYNAYWEIAVDGDDATGYGWVAKLLSYEPVAWQYQGKRTAERPEAPEPVYPPAPRPRPGEKHASREANDAWRAECARIHAAHPVPVFLLDVATGETKTRDEADTQAQTWVKECMPRCRRETPLVVFGEAEVHSMMARFDQARLAYDFATVDRIRGELKAQGVTLKEALSIAEKAATKFSIGALAYSTTCRNNQLDEITALLDAGAGAALLRIYDGSRPATCGTATNLLAELTATDPCAGAAASGALTFSSITADASANATGTATWHRWVDSTGTCVIDGNCGTSGSDLNLNNTSIAATQNVACSSYVITGGNA